MKRACIFIGPTRLDTQIRGAFDVYGPASLGSVFRATKRGYKKIILIDGYFGNVPSVWHKEILYAISEGVDVSGAASIGALRAAELFRFGMKGFGIIFRLYRRGILTDDDEVCVLHSVRELDFAPLSHAMINVRFTLRRMHEAGYLTPADADAVCIHMKRLHFADRTDEQLSKIAATLPNVGNTFLSNFHEYYDDVKRRDAVGLCQQVMLMPHNPVISDWNFPETIHWKNQFENQVSDIPDLA
jgi:hypothetical protein